MRSNTEVRQKFTALLFNKNIYKLSLNSFSQNCANCFENTNVREEHNELGLKLFRGLISSKCIAYALHILGDVA